MWSDWKRLCLLLLLFGWYTPKTIRIRIFDVQKYRRDNIDWIMFIWNEFLAFAIILYEMQCIPCLFCCHSKVVMCFKHRYSFENSNAIKLLCPFKPNEDSKIMVLCNWFGKFLGICGLVISNIHIHILTMYQIWCDTNFVDHFPWNIINFVLEFIWTTVGFLSFVFRLFVYLKIIYSTVFPLYLPTIYAINFSKDAQIGSKNKSIRDWFITISIEHEFWLRFCKCYLYKLHSFLQLFGF